jgi:hypothetical protein
MSGLPGQMFGHLGTIRPRPTIANIPIQPIGGQSETTGGGPLGLCAH